MNPFYHELKKRKIYGYLQVSFLLVIIIIILIVLSNKFINWKQVLNKIKNGKSTDVEIATLISYSNFYRDKYICTDAIHVKSDSFNILKGELSRDQFKGSIWLEYKEGTKDKFDKYVKPGYAAKVHVCGEFEYGRGLQFGNPSVYNHQLTIDEYELLENPQLHNI